MTTPTQLGPNAGPEDSAQRDTWTQKHALALDGQQTNQQTIQRLAMQGVQGVDVAAQVARLTCLLDVLFGTMDGNPGMIQMGDPFQRLEIEILTQQQIAHMLAQVDQMVAQQRAASGQAHQTSSGLFVAGKNDKINGN